MALTKDDLQAIQVLLVDLEDKLDEKLGERFKAHRNWIEFELDKRTEPLKDQITNIPTKEEYFNSMDTLIKEIQEYRIERVALSNQVDSLKQRVDTVDTIVGIKNE